MTYATSNPPALSSQAIAGLRVWEYTSADAIADVDGAGYFTNGGDLGMKVGDIVFIVDTANSLSTISQVSTVSSTSPGATTIVALTAVP
jgi:hypothetical protein